MNEIIQKLATFAPALIAQMKGDPVALEEFTKGYQSTMAQLEEQKRRDQQMTLGMEDRQRMITRQTEQDRIAQEDRDYGKSQNAIEMLSKFVPAQETMGSAETMSQSIMARVPEHLREGVAGVADQQLRQQPQMITDRQRKQAEAFLEKWEKAPRKEDFDKAGVTAESLMIPLPEHLAGYLGKPTAALAEVQKFARLPVGLPQGKTRPPAMAGSFEDYIEKKYGPNATPEQMLEGRKAYGTADDRAPRVTVNTGDGGGLNANQQALMTERLAKGWNDANTSSREMRRQYGLMQTGLKRFREGDKNGGSQAILVTFQKILDPTSVVRETEYARSAHGVSMLARIEGYMDRLATGGAGVPDAELAAMVETGRQMLEGMQSSSSQQRSRIEAMGTKYQIDPVLIFGMETPTGGGTVKMKAPDGQTRDVPADQVEHYKSRGAVVVKG